MANTTLAAESWSQSASPERRPQAARRPWAGEPAASRSPARSASSSARPQKSAEVGYTVGGSDAKSSMYPDGQAITSAAGSAARGWSAAPRAHARGMSAIPRRK